MAEACALAHRMYQHKSLSQCQRAPSKAFFAKGMDQVGQREVGERDTARCRPRAAAGKAPQARGVRQLTLFNLFHRSCHLERVKGLLHGAARWWAAAAAVAVPARSGAPELPHFHILFNIRMETFTFV